LEVISETSYISINRCILGRVVTTALDAAPFRLPAAPAEQDLLAKYFRALGDPTRLRVLELLGDGERSAGELVAALGLPQPQVSNHLACLRWCGFVTTRREHRTIHYRLADDRVHEIVTLAGQLLAENADHVAACTRIDSEC
jgi:ArsR family transcriptional regulator, cadmium/lead-responsive transcriptional repressor